MVHIFRGGAEEAGDTLMSAAQYVCAILTLLVGISPAFAQSTGPAPVSGSQLEASVSSDDYSNLIAIASCDWADRDANCETRCADCSAKAIAWVRTISSRDEIGRTEPAVVFVGIGGTNRIVLLGQKQKPHYRTFRSADYFWGVFVEDTTVPFQTSIDVRYRARAPADDYEEFDPAGKIEPEAKGLRSVRVGLKRFRIRRAPVDVQVTFSRQGPSYGLRQWVRAYRANGSSDVSVAIGAMLPVRLVKLQEFDVDTGTSVTGEPPTGLRIVDEGTNYRVFLTVTMTWPRATDAVQEARSAGTAIMKRLITPEPQFGLGLPEDSFQTLFYGLSWPLYRPLRFSAGYTQIREEPLKNGLFVGQIVPFGTTKDDIRGPMNPRWRLTFGVSIDVMGR